MSLNHGSSIITDGLIFYYDTGNTVKSWKGKPTTNLITSPNNNNITSIDIPQEAQQAGITGYSSYSSGYNVFNRATTSTSGINTFNFSVWMRSPTDNSTYLMYVYTGVGGDGGWQHFGSGSLTTSWQRINATRTLTAGTVTAIQIYRYNQTGTIDICAPQLELNSFMTPFVLGTRTNNDAIKDLIKNTTITANNLTYANDKPFSFNGTSNYCSSSVAGLTNYITISLWVKLGIIDTSIDVAFETSTNFNSNTGAIVLSFNESGNKAYFALKTATSYNAGYIILADTNWHHVCVVYDATQALYSNANKYFLDGILQTLTFSTSTSERPQLYNGQVYVGARAGSTYFFNGEIPNVSIYNRALTSSEIKQNYNALKGRFGL